MEDSEESELVFVVPSSIDNSGSSDVSEDPLGLSTETKSTGTADSASFSCFQLSAPSQEHDSESLHIEEPHDNIIPSSPNVMRIDLSGTPNIEHSSKDAKSASISTDGSNLNDDKDRMSPDMMTSSGGSYIKNKSVKDKNCKSTLSNNEKINFTEHVSVKNTERGNRSQPDNSKLNDNNGSDPYSAETQSYSESTPTSSRKNEASYSMSHYLPQSTDKDSNSEPIFVTLSSQGDSEKPSSTHSNLAPVPTTRDNQLTDTKKDKMSQNEEKGSLQRNQDNDCQSQDISQEGLNLHLTLESQSQMSARWSLPPGGDKDVQSQNEHKDATSLGTGDLVTSNMKDQFDAPQMSESALHSLVAENESGFSMECSRATTFASEESVETQNSTLQSDDITKDNNNMAQNLSEDGCCPLQPENKKDSCSADTADDCCDVTNEKSPSQSVQNKRTVHANVGQPLMMYDDSSNSNDVNSIATKKPIGNKKEVTKDGHAMTHKDETAEINPSMQSTYVNETTNLTNTEAPPTFLSQGTWTDSGSTLKTTSDSPYMDSSDYSMEYSMLDRDRIGDLETQPFTTTQKSGSDKSRSDRCKINVVSSDEASSKDVSDIVKDIVGCIVDSVIEKKGADKSSSPGNFASPNLPKQKEKQPLGPNSTHGRKPMESMDILEARQNVERDKSSDTLPVDENSDHELEPKELPVPKNVPGYVYRVTRSEIVETIFNGEVIERKELPRKVKYLKKCPAKVLAQTSGGSGYLADTSSLSRSSSNSSAKTNLTDSPAFGAPERSLPLEPVPRNELGAITSSSSDSSLNFHSQHLSHTHTHNKSKESIVISSPRRSDTGIPIRSPLVVLSPISYQLPEQKMSSPTVVLTPLSSHQLAAHQARGINDRGNVATPPPTDMNHPISGSTPVDFERKSDTSSDVTNSNSSEFGYLGEPMIATVATAVESCQPSPSATSKVSKISEDTATDGIPVMARPPSDVFFYPGTMHRQDQISGKCMIVFNDSKKTNEIRESDVLLIDKLDVGQEVFVHFEDADYYQAGTILSICQVNNDSGYLVEVESDSDTTMKRTKIFSKKDVIVKGISLTREQKRSFVQPINNIVSSSDVSLDNVVDGKRRSRRATRSWGMTNTISPLVNKTQRSLRKRRRESDTAAQGDAKKSMFIYKKSTNRGSKAFFGNMCFLLTARSRQCLLFESDSEGSNPDVVGYIKKDVAAKIKAGGGQVAYDFTELELRISKCEEAFVVSDNYCRTMNYLQALATGIECVSYRWIVDSIGMSELLPKEDYVLPAGFSLKQVKVVERLKVHGWPLQGMKVLLRLKDHALWRPLLSSAGCDVVTYRSGEENDSPRSFDVIVADSSTISAVQVSTENSGTSVVSVEWVIQCLINSERLPYDGNEQYGFQSIAC